MAKKRCLRLVLMVLASLTVLASACSSSDDSTGTSAEPTPTEESGDEEAGDDEAADDEDAGEPDASDATENVTTEPTAAESEEPTGEPIELTASWQGVTEDTVRIGVTVIDTEELADLFDVHLDLAPSGLIEGLAEAVNADGGINGRELEVFTETFLPVGTGPAEEVCTKFAEDEEVFIVTGQALGDTMLCYTETYEVPYLGFFGLTPERDDRSIAPFMAVEMASNLQRRHSTDILVDGGYLDGKAVGVYASEGDEEMANDEVISRLEDAGIDVAATALLPDFSNDQLATDEAVDVIVESFRANGVEAIIDVSEVVSLSQGIDRVDYRPELYFFNGQVNNADIFEGSGIDPATLTGAIGVAPSALTAEELMADELWLACIEDYNESGPEESLDLATIEDGVAGSTAQHCGGFALLVMLLETAGSDLTPDTLAAAADSLGTFDLPGLPGASMGPDKWSAGNSMRISEYDVESFQFHPVGDPIIVEG